MRNYLTGLLVSLIAKIGTENAKKSIRYGRAYGMGNRKLLRSALRLRL